MRLFTQVVRSRRVACRASARVGIAGARRVRGSAPRRSPGFGQHHVDQPRQFVGGGGDGLRFIHARAHAPEVRAQCRLTGAQCGGGQAQRLGRTVGTALGPAAQDFAAGDLGARAQAHPAREVPVRGEA